MSLHLLVSPTIHQPISAIASMLLYISLSCVDNESRGWYLPHSAITGSVADGFGDGDSNLLSSESKSSLPSPSSALDICSSVVVLISPNFTVEKLPENWTFSLSLFLRNYVFFSVSFLLLSFKSFTSAALTCSHALVLSFIVSSSGWLLSRSI